LRIGLNIVFFNKKKSNLTVTDATLRKYEAGNSSVISVTVF